MLTSAWRTTSYPDKQSSFGTRYSENTEIYLIVLCRDNCPCRQKIIYFHENTMIANAFTKARYLVTNLRKFTLIHTFTNILSQAYILISTFRLRAGFQNVSFLEACLPDLSCTCKRSHHRRSKKPHGATKFKEKLLFLPFSTIFLLWYTKIDFCWVFVHNYYLLVSMNILYDNGCKAVMRTVV
jgi:hypothetical protein